MEHLAIHGKNRQCHCHSSCTFFVPSVRLLCSQTQTHCMPPATASGVRWPASSHSLTAVLPTHHPDRDTQTYISLATGPKSCPNEFRFDQSTTITKGSSSMNKENEPATAGTRSDRHPSPHLKIKATTRSPAACAREMAKLVNSNCPQPLETWQNSGGCLY